MKPTMPGSSHKAFTLIEMLIVVLAIVLLALLAVPMWTDPGPKPARVVCMNNLKQIAVGFMLYASDNSNQLPWQVSSPTHATEIYSKLTPYLKQPKTFICPADKTKRLAQADYSNLSNSNLSYFASLDASFTLTPSPVKILFAGDRHLASANKPVNPGFLSITNAGVMSWTRELHFGEDASEIGVLLFMDGHSEAMKSQPLQTKLQQQGLVANQLMIP
ncbi:MAG TPA: prepilin-type N-terminal cleavage/methylation domain-containing protein [Verrucomicrobiae bacterium]|nr:prepilin-type N-terminal cleavage/methylation domain-containing protein [Verrucomicrobiae bacterium]